VNRTDNVVNTTILVLVVMFFPIMFVFYSLCFLYHCNVSTSVFNVHAYTFDMCTNKYYLLTYSRGHGWTQV